MSNRNRPLRWSDVPPCYRFLPTPEVLLMLLKHRVTGHPNENPFLIEKDLFGSNATPWVILNESDRANRWVDVQDVDCEVIGRQICVITRIPRVGIGEDKVMAAGCGAWCETSGPRFVQSESRVIIGVTRTLEFRSESVAVGDRWVMEEYALAGDFLSPNDSTEYVIVRITKSAEGGGAAAAAPNSSS
ncbi:OLC1v1019342C1 [Oldenlandia corymbosa var. corymbosa]|uniref:OLC1v1019342C1 n=1 Tax=Oldenlandia corymbosa var. corymbosa TaxID=529605 RepID=A0AAV1EDQ8_OLDCO|nr:OLC1v1019342C1 [Oldenlandia corymbosa var. corymbosa]